MSLHLPSRRLARPAMRLTIKTTVTYLVPVLQRRQVGWWTGFRGAESDNKTVGKLPSNPLTEEFLRKKPKQPTIVRGGLSESSIFEDEELAGPKPASTVGINQGPAIPRNPDAMAAALDPDPSSRKRWERKMVIREIHKRGRLSKTQLLKRQEREILSKSHDFKTSVKKLVPLAKQIAGKTVDEAIIQMRFSKKKAAKDVKEHLEHARNEAIVRRGMGLGLPEGKDFKPVKILTKDGKGVLVNDPTRLYVSEAWCGRSLYGKTPDYRARGRMFIMKRRTTSLSLVLKEESTRIRLHNEREKKEKNKKVWVQLPNRPITAQRQYYSW